MVCGAEGPVHDGSLLVRSRLSQTSPQPDVIRRLERAIARRRGGELPDAGGPG